MSKSRMILNQLSLWFESQKRVLPWREDPSPYRVWVSEIMLQQTQVVTVVPYFERFMQKFPSVESLAKAQSDEVMLLWAGLGYYSRARNLHQGAKQIVAQGRFPQTRAEWLDVPGVGPYTAGAILSISYNFPEAILDGNVERVLSRFLKIDRSQGDTQYKKDLWAHSENFVKRAHQLEIHPRILNQALMELGAMVCTPKSPKCEKCPIVKFCQSFQSQDQLNYPPKKAKKPWVHVQERMYCILNKKNEVLLTQRPAGAWRAGLWDLVEESPLRMVDGKVKKIAELKTQHIVTRHKIERVTEVWRIEQSDVKLKKNPKAVHVGEKWEWVSLQTPHVALGSAVKKTFKLISTHALSASSSSSSSR